MSFLQFFNLKIRTIHLITLALAVASLLVAYFFMERYLGLEPCPLCIVDRVIVFLIGVIALLALLHNPRVIGKTIYAVFGILLSALGLVVSGRHIWLQNLPPDRIPDCMPDLDYLIDSLPIDKVITIIFNSSGECAEVGWTFINLSIPQQTLLLFAVFFVLFFLSIVKIYSNPSSSV